MEFLAGIVFFPEEQESSKIASLLSLKSLYFAGVNLGVICAIAVSFWAVACYFPRLLAGLVPGYILLLLLPLSFTPPSISIVMFVFFALLTSALLYLSYMHWFNSHEFSPSLSKASRLLIRNSPVVLATLLVLTIVNMAQILIIHMLFDKLEIGSNIYALPLQLALIVFSHRITSNFMTVFISSKFYMDLNKKKDSLSSSLIHALSCTGEIIKASFAVSFFTFLKYVCRKVRKLEMKKDRRELWDIFLIGVLVVVETVITTIESALGTVSHLIMSYIGIYGGSYDFKTSERGGGHTHLTPSWLPDLQYIQLQVLHCLIAGMSLVRHFGIAWRFSASCQP